MRNLAPFLLIIIFLSSCKSAKTTIITNKKEAEKAGIYEPKPALETGSRASAVINNALEFEGVRYRYGGTTHKGMDCSGLIYVSFKKENINLPRITHDMARRGTPLEIKQVQEGDLLFFKTGKRRTKINHVGLVTEKNDKEIIFIHSTTSRGVIRSSLDETYWNKAFVSAKRIL